MIPWLLVVFAIAALDWYALWSKNKRMYYITKPATLLALITWFVLFNPVHSLTLWFGLGLAFGLIGDVLLLLPDRFFIPGLVAFLLGHLAYIIGLWYPLKEIGIPQLVLLITITVVIRLMAPHLLRNRGNGKMTPHMRFSISCYILVISWMFFLALNTLFRADWNSSAATLAAVGGMLFYASDYFLAFRRFVATFPRARLLVRISYHLAQIALASAAVLNFSATVD